MAQSDSEQSKEWSGKTDGSDFGQRALIWMVKHLGLRTMYAVVALFIPFYVIFNVKERNAIMKYYNIVHHITNTRSFFKVFRNNYLFAKMMLDRLAIMSGMSHRFKIDITNEEVFNDLAHSKQGFMIGSSHIGNFELAGMILKQNYKKVKIVIFGGENSDLQQRRDTFMAKNNISSIPVMKDMSHIFAIKNALDAGEIVTIACDRLLGSSKKIPVDIMGIPCALPMGPFIMAAQTDVPLLSIFVIRKKIWEYSVMVSLISSEDIMTEKSPHKRASLLAKKFASEMEKTIKENPDQWFNFYDFWNDKAIE